MNNKSNNLLCGTVLFLATSAFAQYTLIPPGNVSAKAENNYGGRPASNAVGTLGLDPVTGEHNVDQNNMWMGANDFNFAKWFCADLGSTQYLARIKFWNFNMNSGGTDYSARGVKDIEIYITTDPVAGAASPPVFTDPAWRFVTAYTVPRAPGSPTYTGETPLDFPPVPARWVGFKILSVQSAQSPLGYYSGLSKVRFSSYEGNPGEVFLNSLNATDVGSTFATLPVEISKIDNGGVISVYYGTDENAPETWTAAAYPGGAVSVPDVYGITVTGLACDETVYYHHVVESGGQAFTSGVVRAVTPGIKVLSSYLTTVGANSAQLPGSVTLVPGDSGVLRAYYGTSDEGATTNWTYYADSAPISASASLDITATGLVTGQTYWYRHAFVTLAGDICFAPQSLTFVMGDPNVPCDFRWLPITGNTTDWEIGRASCRERV